jgi:hypothetical protein
MNSSHNSFSTAALRRGVLTRLSVGLVFEQDRANGDLHFRSTDFEQVQALYRALAALTAAHSETVRLIASEAAPGEVMTVMNQLAAKVATNIAEEWQLRHFRAAEFLTRTENLILAAGESLARASNAF